MQRSYKIPLRFKILVTLLLVVTVVVSLITFTMADLFHKDKTAYIHDLTSAMALHSAEQAQSLLEGYRGRLRMYLLLLEDENLTDGQKADKIGRLFEDFSEFVAVTLYDESGQVESTVYDDRVLAAAGLTKESLLKYREENPLPFQTIRSGRVFLENSTLVDELPLLTMALVEPGVGEGQDIVASAVLKLDRLNRLTQRSQVFDMFLVDAQGRILAPSTITSSHVSAATMPDLSGMDNLQSLGMTQEYDAGDITVVGGFARVDFAGLTAGVQIPKSAAYLASRELLRNLVIIALSLLLVSALVSVFWARLITRPLERLSQATRSVGQGEFDVKVQVESGDEIGALAGSFNQMAYELRERESALRAAQAQLVQSEKLAAFGQLGAGIAHEVKNPLAGILGCAQLSLRAADKDSMQEKNLQLIEKETRRCKEIIENLLKFARQEKAEQRVTDLVEVATDAAAIVNHQLELNKVTVEKDLAQGLPEIMGNGNQLQQVLMNLMINAQQAMEGSPGTIWLSARAGQEGQVEVRIRDDGPGIPEDHLNKLFEPFFTTKPQGRGTGLGLSVSYGIVRDHGGEIVVQSEVGVGTTFVLTFPVHVEASGTGPASSAADEYRKAG